MGAVRVGAKISRSFFPLPTLFFFNFQCLSWNCGGVCAISSLITSSQDTILECMLFSVSVLPAAHAFGVFHSCPTAVHMHSFSRNTRTGRCHRSRHATRYRLQCAMYISGASVGICGEIAPSGNTQPNQCRRSRAFDPSFASNCPSSTLHIPTSCFRRQPTV